MPVVDCRRQKISQQTGVLAAHILTPRAPVVMRFGCSCVGKGMTKL